MPAAQSREFRRGGADGTDPPFSRGTRGKPFVSSSEHAVWRTAAVRLRDRLGVARTLQWIDDVNVVRIDRSRSRALLETSSYATARSAREFQSALEGELAVALGMPRISVRIFARRRARALSKLGRESSAKPAAAEASHGATPATHSGAQPAAPPTESIPTLSLELSAPDRRLTLESFVAGACNDLAHRAAQAVAAEAGMSYRNPLVIIGATGTGKTHLAHGIANGYARTAPSRRVVLVSSERFATQFSIAVRSGQGARFRELYREADLLIIDDIQALAGKPETESELLHTIDELVHRRRQVVLCSTLPPKRLPKLDSGLEGRLLQGLVVELKSKDEPTREKLIRARSMELRLELDEVVIKFLARRFERTDQLLGALKRLDAHQKLGQRHLTLTEVESALADLLRGKDDAPQPASIAVFVAGMMGVDADAIRGTSRKPSVVKARQLAMALARRFTLLTLREIGAHFGGRSCACVHFAHRKVALLRDTDARIKACYDEALRRFAMPKPRS
jgi:chromosomal replication initiator protein